MKRTIRIGSRESALAVAQARWVIGRLQIAQPQWCFELVTMKTTGDVVLDRKLDEIGGKGLFTLELETALREGSIDMAVHSLKDMPPDTNGDLPIVAYSVREDPRDALVLPQNAGSELLCIGSSSARRRVQLKSLFPRAQCESVRGNVNTRLRKLDEGSYDALVLAAAGLNRLGLSSRITRFFEVEEMIPSAGQGILAVQGLLNGDYGYLLEAVDNAHSRDAYAAERAFADALNAGCTAPVGAHAVIASNELKLYGLYADEQCGIVARGELSGYRCDARKLGETLAKRLKEEGQNGEW